MAGARQPGPWGLEPNPLPIDDGTSCRAPSPTPGPIGVNDRWSQLSEQNSRHGLGTFLVQPASGAVVDLKTAVADFRRSERWSQLQPVAFQLLGQQSFGLGVAYGLGENVVGSVVELTLLAKTFLLADLYDRAHQPLLAAAFGPVGIFQRALAEVSARVFNEQLRDAHEEREALIAEVRYAITHLGEFLENVKDRYISTWNRFEALAHERTLSSQFHAGRIFGEVLLEVLSLVSGGAAAAKAASKIPRLARLAKLKITTKPSPHAGMRAGGAAAQEAPLTTPSRLRPSASSAARDAPTPASPSTPPPRPAGFSPDEPRVHSRYSDGTPVLEGQQPPRISGPDPAAAGAHSVLRHDAVNNRTYQGREFDAAGYPVRDVDFTNPTFPNGRPRPGHPGPPHQHPWHVNDPAVGPRSGFRRGGPEPIP